MFKKYFKEIVKSLIDINFDRLKQRIDNDVLYYEIMDSFVERLKLSKDRLKRALEADEIESIRIVNMKQADKKIADLVNSLKMRGDD